MIDLHLHTTASDGRLSPRELVARAARAGLTVMSVTDHDTVAGLAEARRAAEAAGIRFVDGIEVTAVHEGRDVHVLGYFINPADEAFGRFLGEQRTRRVERVRAIGDRLARLGAPIDVESLLTVAAEKPGVSIGRPVIGRALVEAGHVASLQEAFDRYLATGQAAFVPRIGENPQAVVEVIHRAGGLASMAHPGSTKQPAVMASLADAGLDAIEVYHSEHSPDVERELESFAREHDLLMTGGSDFHGDGNRGYVIAGATLPPDEFERLLERRS